MHIAVAAAPTIHGLWPAASRPACVFHGPVGPAGVQRPLAASGRRCGSGRRAPRRRRPCAATCAAGGYATEEILDRCGFLPKDLRAAGFEASELRILGLSIKEFMEGGYTRQELRAAGFHPVQLQMSFFK